MKTRQSLVSNSSSSSFILVGRKISINDIKLGTTATYWATGKMLEKANDLMKIVDNNLVDFITNFPEKFEVYVGNVYFLITDVIPPIAFPDVRIDGKYDHHCSASIKQALINYKSDMSEELFNQLKERYGVILDEDTKLPSK